VVNLNDRRRFPLSQPLTVHQVAQARGMQRAGYRLGQIAGILGVLSSDLDRALWENIDTDVETLVAPRRPAPMF
jgi:hypothetical protein